MRNNSDDKKSYAEKLKDPQWQKKRLEIFERDGFKCKMCEKEKPELHVHHKYYIFGKEPWDHPRSLLVTLCKDCHEKEESAKEIQKDFCKVLLTKGWFNCDLEELLSYLMNFQTFDKKVLLHNLWEYTHKINNHGKEVH